MNHSLFLIAIFATAGATPCVGQGPSSDQAMSPEMASSLNIFSQSITPITVHWKQTRSSRHSPDVLSQTWGVGKAFLRPEEFEVAYSDNKIYINHLRQLYSKNKNEYSQNRTEFSFDSIDVYDKDHKYHRGRITDLNTEQQLAGGARMFDLHYFEFIGCHLPDRLDELTTAKPESNIQWLLRNGAIIEIIYDEYVSNQLCKVITLSKGSRTLKYYLSPAHNYTVLRLEEYENKSLFLIVDNSGFQRSSETGPWLPHTCEAKYYGWSSRSGDFPDKPMMTETLSVISLTQDQPSNSRFRLDYSEPGYEVSDSRIPEAKSSQDKFITYRVPANPEDFDKAIKDGVRRMIDRDQSAANISNYMWIIGINAGVVAIAIIMWYQSQRLKI